MSTVSLYLNDPMQSDLQQYLQNNNITTVSVNHNGPMGLSIVQYSADQPVLERFIDWLDYGHAEIIN